MKRISWLVLLGFVLALPVHAASFDCAKASTKVEHLICEDPKLSKLDDDLGAAYINALKDSSDPSSLKHEQQVWITIRNQCESAECIQTEYQERVVSLDEKVSSAETRSSPQPLTKQKKKLVFHLKKDTGWSVCHDMVKNLNDVQPSLASFSTELVFDSKMTQFKWPDWKELDIKDYLDVVYQIENKLMHLYPSQAMPFDEWKKKYLVDMEEGISGKASIFDRQKIVLRPRLRITQVRFGLNSHFETVLAYTRNHNSVKLLKGLREACPPGRFIDVSNPEIIRRRNKCYDNYLGNVEPWGIGTGDFIFLFDPDTRHIRYIYPDRSGGATSWIGETLFIHDQNGYLEFADITGITISRVKRINYENPALGPSYIGTTICSIPSPRFRGNR